MQLYEVIWKEVFAEKIESKHAVSMDEVEQILFGKSLVPSCRKGAYTRRGRVCCLWPNDGRALLGSLLCVEATDRRIADFGS